MRAKPRSPARGLALALLLSGTAVIGCGDKLAEAPSPPAVPAQDPIYVLDLQSKYLNCFGSCATNGRSSQQLLDDHDVSMFATSVQGLVNRTGPHLYLDVTAADRFWLTQAQDASATWGWAAGRPIVQLTGVDDLVATFKDQISGTVRWTADVPAGLNVASTAAGVDGLVVIRAGSSIEAAVTATWPVKLDLVNAFHNKREAAVYARTHYLDKTRPGLLAYFLDGWPWYLFAHGRVPNGPYLYSRDYLIAEKAFFFDLSPWSDEAPNDDPGQPLGADRRELETVLAAAKSALGSTGITSIWGFYPWSDKYAQGSVHHQDPVTGEWATAALTSSYDARITGGGGQSYGLEMANASFHRWGSFPRHAPRNRTPSPAELADLGYVNQHLLNPGFEWGDAGSWTIDAPDRAVYRDPASAAGGAYFLETHGAVTGQSVWQDVPIAVDVGETWRLRVRYRIRVAGEHASLVLWGQGPAGATPAQATLDQADGAWHTAEVSLGPTTIAFTSLRAQIYLASPGVDVDLDELRLARTTPWDNRVAPLTYVSTMLGDYDFGTPIYTFPVAVSPVVWNDHSRGAVPIAWDMAPDTIDYLPGIMAYYYGTRGPLDFFTVADSGAGYVNPTEMTGPGADLFVRLSRRAMGRMGESFLSFFLNGNAGTPDPATIARWSKIGPDGVMVNWRQLGPPTRRLTGNVAWAELEQNWSFAGITAAAAIANIDSAYRDRYGSAIRGSGPRFLYGRSVYTGTDFASGMFAGAQAANPDRDYTVVDPYTFGFVMRASLGGTNTKRTSWISDSLPRAALPSDARRSTIEVRNDGWETWAVGDCSVGVVVSRDAEATPLAPLGHTVLMVPIAAATAPGETTSVPLSLPLPEELGLYHLAYDVACGGVWFESAGNVAYHDTLEITLTPPMTDGGSDTGGGNGGGGCEIGTSGPCGSSASLVLFAALGTTIRRRTRRRSVTGAPLGGP